MLPSQNSRLIPTHWGTFEAKTAAGRIQGVQETDGTACEFWENIQDVLESDLRIKTPAVRKSFLDRGADDAFRTRGEEPFVPVDWDTALDLAAHHLSRIAHGFGNEAIFGGSYGWASAGRFHHAQSQVHRFLNSIGGYTRSVNSYSYGAAEVILPHVIGGLDGLSRGNTPWSSICDATDLIVAFGGISEKNSKSNPGGVSKHRLHTTIRDIVRRKIKTVSISPVGDDSPSEFAWLPIIPNTDVPLMLALAFVIASEGLADRGFLDRYTVGYERFEAYVLGAFDGVPKDPQWASAICGVSSHEIASLARLMAQRRTMIMMSWSLQRSENGEQPYWLAIVLAAMIGQIGLPGGGFGFGYGAINSVGHDQLPFSPPSLPQLANEVKTFIPVARIADMLLNPGRAFRYNGRTLNFPEIRLIYWAGGNPFHHHQDLHRLRTAWAKPEVVIVNEIWWNATARHADIVFPTKLQFERDDLVCTKGEARIFAAAKVVECPVDAKSDYDIFSGLSSRLGSWANFTEGRTEEDWIRNLYDDAKAAAEASQIHLPDFDDFWAKGSVEIPVPHPEPPLLEAFRNNPVASPLRTPSGRIEIFSKVVAGFGDKKNPGHPVWIEPSEWAGASSASKYPLHLLSNQPSTKLHSQFDHSPHSRSSKIMDREPIRMHPADAAKRLIRDRDIVKVFNERGSFLAAAVLSKEIRPGVLQIATGAWLDIETEHRSGPLEIHGNPNVVTHDRGTSEIAQASAANSCLVDVVRYDDPLPPLKCFVPPDLADPLDGGSFQPYAL